MKDQKKTSPKAEKKHAKAKAAPSGLSPYISPTEAIFGKEDATIEKTDGKSDEGKGIGSISQTPQFGPEEIEFNVDEEKEEVERRTRISLKRIEIEKLRKEAVEAERLEEEQLQRDIDALKTRNLRTINFHLFYPKMLEK